MKNKIVLIFLSTILFCPQVFAGKYTLPSPEGNEYTIFSADMVSFDVTEKVAHLEGNSLVTHYLETGEIIKLEGNKIDFYTDTMMFKSPDKMKITSGDIVLEGQNAEYDYNTQRVKLEDTSAEYPPVRILSAKKFYKKGDVSTYKHLRGTCCSNEKPHYTVSMTTLKINQKRASGWNAIFWINNKVPVFYLPYFSRSLKHTSPFTTYVDLGADDRNGFTTKTTTFYSITEELKAKGMLDYFAKDGVGAGIGAVYDDPGEFNGVADYYTIDPPSRKRRWGLQGGFWGKVRDTSEELEKEKGALYTVQSRYLLSSDAFFNDDYFRDNPYLTNADQFLSGSINRQTRKTALRVSYDKQKKYNAVLDEFVKTKEDNPKINYQVYPLRPFNAPWVNKFKFNYGNTYNATTLQNQKIADMQLDFIENIYNSKFIAITPTVFVGDKIIFEDANNSQKDTNTGRVGGNLNADIKNLKDSHSLDVGYAYTKRTSTDTIKFENNATDSGEDVNEFFMDYYYRPNYQFHGRLTTEYDLRNQPFIEGWDPKYRFKPLIGEIGYDNDKNMRIFVQDTYNIFTGNDAFLLQTDFGRLDRKFLSLGLSNYKTTRNKYTFITKAGMSPENWTWDISAGIDFDVNKGDAKEFNKFIRLVKDLHDLKLGISLRDRNNNFSISFTISFLCGGKEEGGVENRSLYQDGTSYRNRRYRGYEALGGTKKIDAIQYEETSLEGQ